MPYSLLEPMDPQFVIAGLLILLSFSTAALAGFGATVIALTLGAHVYPIAWWVPRLLSLNVVLMAYLVARHRGHADRALLFRRILPLMGLGMLIGYPLASRLTGPALELALGAFVALMSARELLSVLKVLKAPSRPLPGPVGAGLMLVAGVIHGIYASGGPLLVYALSRLGLEKASFRSTLAVVWLILNSVLFTVFIINGQFDLDTAKDTARLLPVVAVATALGEWGHSRVDEARFRTIIYVLLLVAGTALLFH